jgi:DNA (cytosine-5)-methyltransferase 1
VTPLRIGSLFSGIGGLELGLELAGLGEPVWQVEQKPFCLGVLARHWPDVERHADVRTVGKHNLAPVDLVCGGFPCQDVSSAGARKGLAGSRSGLWFEYARIVRELRPEWVIVENVASGAKLWVDRVLWDLGELGYAAIPLPLSAQDVGAPHERARVFVVARQWQSGHAHAQPPGGHPRSEGCAHAPHAERVELRDEQGRGRGSGRTSAPKLANAHGDAHGQGESALREHAQVAGVCSVAGDTRPWASPPYLRRVDDGFPDRVDRNRALGNAVVPQCAEVIGWIVRELIESSCIPRVTR